MFRLIRKKKNELSLEECKDLLKNRRRGVLSLYGVEGYPYGIPINYIYDEETGAIYFHGAKTGHKVDALKASDKVSFAVLGPEVVKKEAWAPFVKSVVLFGTCQIIQVQQKALYWLKKFALKYYPSEDLVQKEIDASFMGVQMFELTIDHMSGKEVQEI